MIALVDPPMAMSAVIAFSNEASVRMSRGLRSSQTISTTRRPQLLAIRQGLASTAGIEEAPDKVNPSVSAIAVMVEAVPIVMQWPGLRAMPSSISDHSQSLMLPAFFSAQYFQTSLPLPKTFPFQFPRNIGPAGK